MVYEKKKSGDPDYDDKQPADVHAAKVVTSPDGREVLITEAAGPVDRVTGQHVNLDEAPDARDNRPAPGEVAKEVSEVQTYEPEDTPVQKVSLAEAKGEGEDRQAPAAAQSGDQQAAENATAAAAKPARGRTAK